MSRFRARATVFFLTAALGCATAAVPALAANASAPGTPLATGWLAAQLVQGNHFVSVYDKVTSPAQGETIDAILAFAAAKDQNAAGGKAISWLKQPAVLSGYIGAGTESYVGATAKVALAAEVRDYNPTHFGNVNLIARLGKLLTRSGRYSDHSAYGDYSNAFSQALAIIALSRHGGASAKAVSFLISSECKNGGYPLDFAQKKCASDTDATAMDVQALLAAGQRSAALRGLKWLASVQQSNGGFDAAGATSPNANTTGLAGEAFAAAGQSHEAARAAKFLTSLQVGCSAPSTERGALTYDKTGYNVTTAVDATAQGILGLADVSLAKLSSLGSSNTTMKLVCAG
jgi:hypothetical protein